MLRLSVHDRRIGRPRGLRLPIVASVLGIVAFALCWVVVAHPPGCSFVDVCYTDVAPSVATAVTVVIAVLIIALAAATLLSPTQHPRLPVQVSILLIVSAVAGPIITNAISSLTTPWR